MCTKVAVLLVLVSLAYQGVATSAPSSHSTRYSSGVIDTAAAILPRLGFANEFPTDLSKCVEIVRDVVAEAAGIVGFVYGFQVDATVFFKKYGECSKEANSDKIKACQEGVRQKYIESIKLRVQYIRESLEIIFEKAKRLPQCMNN